jgi:hypothetical protein
MMVTLSHCLQCFPADSDIMTLVMALKIAVEEYGK